MTPSEKPIAVRTTGRRGFSTWLRDYFWPALPYRMPVNHQVEQGVAFSPRLSMLVLLFNQVITRTPYRKREYVWLDPEAVKAVRPNMLYLRAHSLKFMKRWLLLGILILFAAHFLAAVPTVGWFLGITGISVFGMGGVFYLVHLIVTLH